MTLRERMRRAKQIDPKRLTETKYGFDWGGVVIERICSKKDGTRIWLSIGVTTPAQRWDIYVSATGRVTCVRRKDIEAAARKLAKKRGRR